jgi:iron complex transport system ATP-binding protein
VSVALRFEELSIGYQDRSVLREVSLTLRQGEVLAVVGPNGVGKSTLIKAASGILPLQAGRLLAGERDLVALSPEQRARFVAVVPQAVNLPPTFLAQQVVMMGRTPYLGWLASEKSADIQHVNRAMEQTSTEHLIDRPVGELSGGERQRLLVARALAQAARVLLLDEPTAHLDLRHQDEVLKLVRQLASSEGLAVMIALHDLNLVARYADRVALLDSGSIRAVGSPTEVLKPEQLAQVYGVTIHVVPHPVYGTPLVLTG